MLFRGLLSWSLGAADVTFAEDAGDAPNPERGFQRR